MGEFIGFPNPLARESEKESKDYGLSFFKAMYRAWAGENETLLDQRSIRYRRARQYAGGYQDEDQYKDLLNKEGDLSYLNLNWDIVPIIPKFIDLVVNSITNYEFDIKARAIDPVSSDKRKKKEMDLKTKMLSKKFMKELQEISGMPLVEDNEFIPETEDEVNLFMQLSYKQASEIAIEQGLELAMTINDWAELSKRIVRDLVVLGISSVKTELDHRGVIIRYADPEFLVTSTSEHPDFKDITWAGEIRRVRISDLKAEAGNQISEKEYEHIADRFRGRHGNPTSFDRQPYMDGTFTRYDYDRFLVDVLEGQFIVPNKLRAEKKYNRYGNYTIHRKDDNYKKPKNSKYNREIIETDYQCKYSGKWILGTECIYDYGKAKNQIRAKSSLHKTKLDFIIYGLDMNRMQNKSLCERMIPFGDQIQLSHLKLQHILAKSRPKGMAMEVGAIENVPNGKGGTFKPLDVLDIYDQTGVYFFRYVQDDGSPTQARPITELEGGAGSVINEIIAQYEHNLRMIRDVSGVNEAREGSVPDKDSVVGVAKMNLIASNTATKSIHDAYLNIYKRTAESTVLMIQDLVEYDKPYGGYVGALGQQNMDIIEVTRDVSLYEFGIIIEVATDEKERQTLELDMRAAIENKELRPEDAAVARSIGNTKLANQYMLLKRKEYIAEQLRQSRENAEANAQQQAASAQAAAQAEIQKEAQVSKIRMQEEQNKKDLEARLEQVRHKLKMEEIRLQNEGDVDVAQVNEREKTA